MMRFLRWTGGSGEYERVMRDDDEGSECDWVELCSACIVVGGAKVVVVRRKRDEPFTCARCQTLVDERWMDGDGRSSLQSPVAALKKTAIKGKL
tara:strand:- start:363 stop:644 length:282 start_codon:yes stop_codon:yes gene_type:complete